MKTTIYLRTSTEEQDPENQLRDCKSLAKGEYKVVMEKQSAFKDKDRPLFESIKKDIQARRITELIAWDLDRLYRNRKKLIEFFAFCKIYGCKVNSYRQQWLNDLDDIPAPFNEMMHSLMLQIMGWLAEEESAKKSERVKAAFQRSTKKWGRKPIKKVDTQIKELYDKGESMRSIAAQVYYWDSARNKKHVSKSYVHNIISRFKGKTS